MSSPDPRLPLGWITQQRWYAGRHRDATGTAVVASVPLESEQTIAADIVEIAYAAGDPEQYFVPDLTGADPETVVRALWQAVGSPPTGLESVVLEPLPDSPSTVQPLRGEQSNSSALVDHEWVLKIIRRLEPGANPEVEVGTALRARGSVRVAPLSAALRLHAPGDAGFDVLTVHRRVAGEDGFELAVADAQSEAAGGRGAHFPGAAYELGIALGALHDDLVAAFGTARTTADQTIARLRRRLDAVADVAELAPYHGQVTTRLESVAASGESLTLQRIHGDLHLGQARFGPDGWIFLDFEGEPLEPLDRRRAPDSPMRDLAGVLRSFDYAARWQAGDRAAGDAWRERNAELFVEGYELQRGERVDHDLLGLYELDKAVYEVGYEAAHRPERVSIPLHAIRRLVGDEPLR
ncbi:hypothetical protein EK0264_16655 [Epidermidibacterium keratini]|uniref:Maltokinase n=1 Tax=Epidermidibacterium keratini TaxID=1891644 RepID=A0A7L4YRJ6_9ACTN|nr:hypothetical protein [Epidermidibacterium keratini]QHC01750.1 hypothetical protein EK0264_16655 [Epidermidibacterium keratini]